MVAANSVNGGEGQIDSGVEGGNHFKLVSPVRFGVGLFCEFSVVLISAWPLGGAGPPRTHPRSYSSTVMQLSVAGGKDVQAALAPNIQ